MNYDDKEHELCIAMQTIEKLEGRVAELYDALKTLVPKTYVRIKKQHDEEDANQ